MIRTAAALLCCGPLWAHAAHADPAIRTGELPGARAKFLANAGPLRLEGFDALRTTPATLIFADFTITATQEILLDTENTRAITQGRQALGFEEDRQTEITIRFDAPITAFGLDINDLSYAGIDLRIDDGPVQANVLAADNGSDLGGPGFINQQFLGILSHTPFRTLTLTLGSDTGGLITFDGLLYQPATLIHSK